MRLKVDVIVAAGGVTLIRAAKNATKTIPIVMTGTVGDPVEAGLVESLARPGGNVTGITNLIQRTRRQSGWSCLKKPFPKLPVSRFSTNPTIPGNLRERKRSSSSRGARTGVDSSVLGGSEMRTISTRCLLR